MNARIVARTKLRKADLLNFYQIFVILGNIWLLVVKLLQVTASRRAFAKLFKFLGTGMRSKVRFIGVRLDA